MAIYKSVEPNTGTFQKTIVNLGESTVTPLTGVVADRTDITDEYGHLFASFNLPITSNQQSKYTVTFTNGGFSDTSFSGHNRDQVLFIEIPRTEYGELIDGKSIKLDIQTGATITDKLVCYSTFISKSNYTNTFDSLYSDNSPESETYGQPRSTTNTNSNIAFLVSDSIKKPQGDTSKSWATGYNSATAFYSGGKEPLTHYDTNPSLVDQPVGIAFLDKGFMAITHPTVVTSFLASGSSSGLSITYDSFNTEYIQHVVCLAGINEFYTTSNETFLDAYGTAGVGTESVLISEIGLYNGAGDLIAIAKPDRPISKSKNGLVVFDIQIKI